MTRKILILTGDAYKEELLNLIDRIPVWKCPDLTVTFNPKDEYDVGMSFMNLKKITKEQLDGHIWINFHPGPLPKYKGRNLAYHAILNGEKMFGASVHYVDENFDTGSIIAVSEFAIESWSTAEEVYHWAILHSYRLFEHYLPLFALDDYRAYSVPNIGGTYYHKEPISDFIDLPEEIKRQVRAITFGEHHPQVNIGGRVYKIVPELTEEE